MGCPRRLNIDPPCRSNIDPGRVAAGTCTIAANQAGNANYTAALQVTQNITVALPPAVSVDLTLGWNLLGNSVNAPLDVTTALGNAAHVAMTLKRIG